MYRSQFLLVIMLIICLTGFIPVANAATYQEQLDAGYLSITSDYSEITLQLKAKETYYIGIAGGRGGYGGGAYTCEYDDNGDGDPDWDDTSWKYVPNYTSFKYYEIIVGSSNVSMELGLGSNGSNGTHGRQSNGSTPSPGGAGGTNALGLGNGTNGGASTDGGKSGNHSGYAGGGGGGGAATVLRFNNNNSQVLSAPGTDGAEGYRSYNADASGSSRYYADGGTAGIGGTLANSATISGLTWRAMSAAEASVLGISLSNEHSFKILKKFTLDGNSITFEELPVGSHINLTSNTGNVTTFKKVSESRVDYIAGYASGIYWYNFPSYAVSGSSSGGSSTYLILKKGLTFIGGDGTLTNPMYSAPPGQSEEDNVIDYTEQYNKMAQSMLFAAEKQDEQAQAVAAQTSSIQAQLLEIQQQTLLLEEQIEILSKPKLNSIKLLGGATATKNLNVSFVLSIEDPKYSADEIKVYLSEDGFNWTEGGYYRGAVNYSFSSKGFKTIKVKIENPDQNYSVGELSFWIL